MTPEKFERQEAVKVIGAAIRVLREQRGLTLERLATNAGISYQYLSGIETGKENFSIAILEKVAKALHVTLLVLIETAYRPGARDGSGDVAERKTAK